jgi:DNA-binding HxlR family transcriptional regulator
MYTLAQALAPLAPVTPIRNHRRTEGSRLEQNGAGPFNNAARTALEIISSGDRAKIVASTESALGVIRGKWKVEILVNMLNGPIRLGQLRRLIPRASKKVMVQQLHEMEKDGIIVRTDLSGKIKHVEYAISAPLGIDVMNLLGLLSDWGSRHAPAIALHGGTRRGATPVLPMPAKSEITAQAAPSALFGPKCLHRVQP